MIPKYYTHEGELSSSALSAYWYDEQSGDFFVEFPGGRIAGYKDVSMTAFRSFLDSPSKGGFYAKSIKQQFVGQSGDVSFVKRPITTSPAPAPEGNPCVSVGNYEVAFTATMTAQVRASSKSHPGDRIASIEGAIEELKKLAADNSVGDVSIKSVTLRFE